MSTDHNNDRWPILEPSQIDVFRWLSKHVPEFKPLPRERQAGMVLRAAPRAIVRPRPLALIVLLIAPGIAVGYLFEDRMSWPYLIYAVLMLAAGWLLLSSLTHEIRRVVRRQLTDTTG